MNIFISFEDIHILNCCLLIEKEEAYLPNPIILDKSISETVTNITIFFCDSLQLFLASNRFT